MLLEGIPKKFVGRPKSSKMQSLHPRFVFSEVCFANLMLVLCLCNKMISLKARQSSNNEGGSSDEEDEEDDEPSNGPSNQDQVTQDFCN